MFIYQLLKKKWKKDEHLNFNENNIIEENKNIDKKYKIDKKNKIIIKILSNI